MDISPMCAVELLEIIKYLDDELKKNIPQDFEIYLNSIKDNNYHFEINKNINLFGYITNPYKILNSSKILVMTSRYEGTPMVALEAMALGKPIISTPTDGLKDIVKQKNNGFLSNCDNELENEIIDLLKDNNKLKEYSENSLIQFKKISDINKYIFEIKKIYEKV